MLVSPGFFRVFGKPDCLFHHLVTARAVLAQRTVRAIHLPPKIETAYHSAHVLKKELTFGHIIPR